MNHSFLIFGREPSVSFAELYQHLGQTSQKISVANREAVLVDDPEFGHTAPDILAGVVKSGLIVKTAPSLSAEILASILELHLKKEGKFNFGLSFYGFSTSLQTLTLPSPLKGEGNLKRLGLEVKKILKQSGASVRLVESRSGNLSSADVVKNRLLDKGVELCLLKAKDEFLIGQTLAVQPFEEYSERDYGRPARDSRSGMLPPKLAKAMVNIASRGNRGLKILDPFCGSGTVLQESLLLGCNVIGTDIEARAIADSKKNLEWLLNRHSEIKYVIPTEVRRSFSEGGRSGGISSVVKGIPRLRFASLGMTSNVHIEKCDVRQLGNILSKNSVDAIVSEFDLGPPLSGKESEGKIKSIVSSLNDFYLAALHALQPILKDAGQAVLAWQYFKKFYLFIPAFDELEQLGWQAEAPYPESFEKDFPLSRRNTLLYGRQGQYVWREILILKKTDRG